MFIMGLKKLMLSGLRDVGYDIVKYKPASHPLARRKKILDSNEINLVLDVGANTG